MTTDKTLARPDLRTIPSHIKDLLDSLERAFEWQHQELSRLEEEKDILLDAIICPELKREEDFQKIMDAHFASMEGE